MNPFLDYSQYYLYDQCPLKWYEKYVAQVARQPASGYADTPLSLGACVHAGLQLLRESRRVEIPGEVIAETGCSPEYAAWARTLVAGYAAHYPGEEFPESKCEAPLRFELTPEVDGLAKVDYYWRVPAGGQLISDGLGGELALAEGFWIKEYKTRDSRQSSSQWQMKWRVNMQADFQMLALAALVGETPRGILVDTLEKPPLYVPKRTCKGCGEIGELRFWFPQEDGTYKCPVCPHTQKLDISDKSKVVRKPTYYRFKVERKPEALEYSASEMREIAEEMQEIRSGERVARRRTNECVAFGQCEYFEPHALLRCAEGFDGFVQIDATKYVGEKKEDAS